MRNQVFLTKLVNRRGFLEASGGLEKYLDKRFENFSFYIFISAWMLCFTSVCLFVCLFVYLSVCRQDISKSIAHKFSWKYVETLAIDQGPTVNL